MPGSTGGLNLLEDRQHSDTAHVALVKQNVEGGLDLLLGQIKLLSNDFHNPGAAWMKHKMFERTSVDLAVLKKAIQCRLDLVTDEGRNVGRKNNPEPFVAQLEAHEVKGIREKSRSALLHGRQRLVRSKSARYDGRRRSVAKQG